MDTVFQSVTCMQQQGQELLLEIEECDPAIDAVAELTVDGVFAEDREAEVLHWICGLLSVPTGQVVSARVVELHAEGRSTCGRSLFTAKLQVTLKDARAYEVGDSWHAIAVPALGFGGRDSFPLWHYEKRSIEGSALAVALHQLAKRWVAEGGQRSVVPNPMPLVESAKRYEWPLAGEVDELMRALDARATQRHQPNMRSGIQEDERVKVATSVLSAALAKLEVE